MRIAVCLLLALGACNFGGGEGDDYYTEPGGGGGSFGQGSGANVSDGGIDGGPTISGQICGLVDFRDWDSCVMSGFDGYLVELGASQATANDSGVFQISTPGGSNLVWKVYASDTAVRPAYTPFVLTSTQVFTLREAAYADLANANVVVPDGGAVFVRVRKAGAPLVDATAVVSPAQVNALTFYDDVSATIWGNDNTGPAGVVWLPNVPASTATVTITPDGPGATPSQIEVPVIDQATTFVTVDLP